MAAIKRFNHDDCDLPGFRGDLKRAIGRERKIMQKMNHKNILSLIRSDRIEKTGQTVLALEYCNKGSLNALIGENPNGLPSKLFFPLLNSLTSGIGYLYDCELIHRDLKPDNILVSVRRGQYNFKIGDFGEAKELQHDEEYGSIQGTYEFLHPDKFALNYADTLKTNTKVKAFGWSHELWSVQITLFEALTAKLAFPPPSRKETELMYAMTTGKGTDDICGVPVQTENGYEILYSDKLPDACTIPNKPEMEQFLANLLRVNIDPNFD